MYGVGAGTAIREFFNPKDFAFQPQAQTGSPAGLREIAYIFILTRFPDNQRRLTGRFRIMEIFVSGTLPDNLPERRSSKYQIA